MIVRVLTGLGLIILFVGVMLLDILAEVAWPALVVGTFLVATAAYELFVMASEKGARPFMVPGVLAAAFGFNLPWILEGANYIEGWVAVLAATVFLSFIQLFWRASRENALTDLAITVFGAVYVGLLGSYLVRIQADAAAHGAALILYYIAVAKASDIGGYLTGKFFGKHKLAPSISPGKTIEGSLGGIFLSLAVGFGLYFLLPTFMPIWIIVFAIVVNIAAQFGDLSESMIKRSVEVKDSAVFLPKVVGALDLIDSVLTSAPVAFYIFWFAV